MFDAEQLRIAFDILSESLDQFERSLSRVAKASRESVDDLKLISHSCLIRAAMEKNHAVIF